MDYRMLTVDRLRELLNYDPQTGMFVWLRPHGTVKIGDEAGCVQKSRPGLSYRSISIGRRLYKAHRLAWLYVHGEWPPCGMEIDHADGDGLNNRLSNLRPATVSQNQANARHRVNSASGRKGVCWNKRDRKWQARIRINGYRVHLGNFDDPETAAAAYRTAALAHFKEFARFSCVQSGQRRDGSVLR